MALAPITVLALSATAFTHAQVQTFAPSGGQSADQQSKDGAECQAIAVQQSGFARRDQGAQAQQQQTAAAQGQAAYQQALASGMQGKGYTVR
jgi:hypothetical protein